MAHQGCLGRMGAHGDAVACRRIGFQGRRAPSPQLRAMGSPSQGRAVLLDSPASPTKTSWGGLGGPSPTALYTLMRIS